jgi:hypothetical protein
VCDQRAREGLLRVRCEPARHGWRDRGEESERSAGSRFGEVSPRARGHAIAPVPGNSRRRPSDPRFYPGAFAPAFAAELHRSQAPPRGAKRDLWWRCRARGVRTARQSSSPVRQAHLTAKGRRVVAAGWPVTRTGASPHRSAPVAARHRSEIGGVRHTKRLRRHRWRFPCALDYPPAGPPLDLPGPESEWLTPARPILLHDGGTPAAGPCGGAMRGGCSAGGAGGRV